MAKDEPKLRSMLQQIILVKESVNPNLSFMRRIADLRADKGMIESATFTKKNFHKFVKEAAARITSLNPANKAAIVEVLHQVDNLPAEKMSVLATEAHLVQNLT